MTRKSFFFPVIILHFVMAKEEGGKNGG
jgi:hypothetical protein